MKLLQAETDEQQGSIMWPWVIEKSNAVSHQSSLLFAAQVASSAIELGRNGPQSFASLSEFSQDTLSHLTSFRQMSSTEHEQ